MGTAKHKHIFKNKNKINSFHKLDRRTEDKFFHNRMNLPGRRMDYEDIRKIEIETGESFCGYARNPHLYRRGIIALCPLLDSRRCSHPEYIFRENFEDCPRCYTFYQRRKI